jgi:membrane associated rhomboid family serine protease
LDEEKPKIRLSLLIATAFITLLWLIRFFEIYTKIDLSIYGVYPRKASGLIGILTAPLLHSDFSHIVSNTLSLFILTFFIFYFYIRASLKVFAIIYIFHGLLVWLFAREAYHLGASGLIYGFASFLFFMGVLRKDTRSIAVSLLVIFLYGGLVWGVLPTDPKVSYEAHLFGALVGILCAFIFRKTDPLPKKYEWEDEEEDEVGDGFENDINPDDVKIKDNARPTHFSN